MQRRALRLLVAIVLVVGVAGLGIAVTDGVFVDGTITLDATDGPEIDLVTTESEMQLDGPDGPNTVEIVHTDGTIVFESNGPSAARITAGDISGEWTVVSQIDASNELTIDPEDKQSVSVDGGIDSIEFRNTSVDNGAVDFSYAAGSGTSSVTLRGLPADENLIAVDHATGDVVSQSTADGSGAGTFGELPDGEFDIRIASVDAPVLSDPSPPDGSTVDETPVNLTINVTDGDFDTTTDEVDVRFYDAEDDTLIGNQTIAENSTVAQEWDMDVGGQKEWYVVANDSFGASTTSETFTFSAPGKLRIFDESDPETLIDDRTVELEFFDLQTDEIFTRQTDNGSVDLEGIPNNDLIIRMDTEGFHSRNVILRGIFEQEQRVYLLNETEIQTVRPTFLINDETGQFDGSSSRVYIERGLNIDNETRYHTIAAEEVGTDGVSEEIESDQRYRIIVENEDGDTRVLGKFSATSDELFTLTVDELVFELGADDDMIQWHAQQVELNDDEWAIRFNLSDPEGRIHDLSVRIFERGNETNELLNETYAGPITQMSIIEPLTAEEVDKRWVVEWDAERNPEYGGMEILDRGQFPLDIPVSPIWMEFFAGGVILLVGGLASQINAPSVGFAVAGTAGVFWFIGFLPPVVSGGVMVVGFTLPVLYILSSGGVR